MKSAVFPEYVALLHAAKVLGKPVKWADQRSESFVSDHHGRDSSVTAELALDNAAASWRCVSAASVTWADTSRRSAR